MTAGMRRTADINVTPLIDVMLVLLIIFMVVTPLAHRSLDAALPAPASSPIRNHTRPAPLVVDVGPEGYGVRGEPLGSLVSLEHRLRDVLAVRTDKTVLVKVSGAVSYGHVVSGLDAARGAGAERIGLLPATATAESLTSGRKP